METQYKATMYISRDFQAWDKLHVGQWIMGLNEPLGAYRGQYLGIDQFGAPIINIAPLRGTPRAKQNNWKSQFKSNHSLRCFSHERNEVK